MIRFQLISNQLTPVESADASENEKLAAQKIANVLNGVSSNTGNYKGLLENIDKDLQKENIAYQDYVDDQTVTEIESFYQGARGIQPWNSSQGSNLENIDFNFYKGLVPDKVQTYENAQQSVSFGGKQIKDIDITAQYPDLNSYLHADYTFVGAPAGMPGKPRQVQEYTEELRAPTDRERQILRETLLGTTTQQPQSLAEQATQNFVDAQGEATFGALASDAIKQTLNEYKKAMQQEKFSQSFQEMGLPSLDNFKQGFKESLLGDMGQGGFLSFSKALDKSLGTGSSVSYNWQKWFDETLSKRYENMQEIKDPKDAEKTYQLEQGFVANFIDNYLKPRFDTSKSINEFVSYMDVKQDEQNVLQTQLASSALKDFANKQSQAFIDSLGTQATSKSFDPAFYWDPKLIEAQQDSQKQNLYNEQKANVETAWNEREGDNKIKDDKTWKQWAYEYGLDINNRDDFARLHYELVGKNSNYDPVADTYNNKDLVSFVQGDLARALTAEKSSYQNPTFLAFVSAQTKADDLVNQLNMKALPEELKTQLKGLGLNADSDPTETLKEALVGILSTDPALKIREQLRQLNEQRIKPTQENLGYAYIQREEDDKAISSGPESALYEVFKKAGYSGSENEFYTDFFPDTTEEDRQLTNMPTNSKKRMQSLTGFSLPDFSDPFAAMGSIDSMLNDDSTSAKETYKPKRSTYFNYFEDEKDEGAPSYFNMGTESDFGSLFG